MFGPAKTTMINVCCICKAPSQTVGLYLQFSTQKQYLPFVNAETNFASLLAELFRPTAIFSSVHILRETAAAPPVSQQ